MNTKRNHNKIIWLLLLSLFFICSGCSTAEKNDITESTQKEISDNIQTGIQEPYGIGSAKDMEEPSADGMESSEDAKGPSAYRIESSQDILSVVPEFSGEPYCVLNNNCPNFTEEEKKSKIAFENYSDLDALGRCGTAYANICLEIMPTEDRGAIGQIKPSGWQLTKYDNVDGKYLYNRCHLIGYQLAGENANEKNLITGTRYFNVSGMLPFENEVAEYVKATGNHVLYRVTPVYEGDNLVAAGVQMEAYSVEDDGAGICFHVFVYNSQPGIEIDYATGESRLMEEDSGIASQEVVNPSKEDSNEQAYVLNTNTKRFHLPTCSSVDDMKEKNKKEVTCSREELITDGYVPCQRCNP